MDIDLVKGKIGEYTKYLRLTNIANYFDTDKETKEIEKFVANVSHRNDVPEGDWVPEDLKDTNSNWELTRDGFPVAGQVLPESISVGSDSPVLPLVLALAWTNFYISMLIIKSGMFSMGLLSIIPAVILVKRNFTFIYQLKTLYFAVLTFVATFSVGFLTTPLTWLGGSAAVDGVTTLCNFIPVLMLLLYFFIHERDIALTLVRNGNTYSGSVHSSKQGKGKEERELQALNVYKEIKNGVPRHEVGTAEGVITAMGGPNAPDKSKKIISSYEDYKKHKITFGEPGTGKTSGTLIPDIDFLLNQDCGMMIMCGKNSLPDEIDTNKITKISPKTIKHFNPIEGLTAVQIAEAFRSVLSPRKDGNENAVFGDQSQIMFGDICIFREALVKFGILEDNVRSLLKVASAYKQRPTFDDNDEPVFETHPLIQLFQIDANHPEKDKVIDLYKKMMNGEGVIGESYFRLREHHTQDAKMRANTEYSMNSWINPITQEEGIQDWIGGKSDISLKKISEGLNFSFSMPQKEYGVPGLIFMKLVQAQIVKILNDRGSDWKDIPGQKHIFLIVDECQSVFNKIIVEAMATIRGFGGTIISATQNYESLENTLGISEAATLWASIGQFITYRTSEKTYEVISKRVGQGYIWKENVSAQRLAFSPTAKMQTANSIFDPNNPENSFIRRSWNSHKTTSSEYGIFRRARVSGHSIDDNDSYKVNTGIVTYKLSDTPMPLFNDIVKNKLHEPFKAFVCLNVGGVRRMDVCSMHPLKSDFTSLENERQSELQRLRIEVGIA